MSRNRMSILLKSGFRGFAQKTLRLFIDSFDEFVVGFASFDVDLLLGWFDVANVDSPSSDAVHLFRACYENEVLVHDVNDYAFLSSFSS